MKNLKKVLAFALVVCMMLSTIVSATAISATEFTDYSTIKNADAVAVLTELGVINGYPTGDYKPEKTVSRAEMAKMITVILNKGTDAAGNYEGVQVFSDVYNDMWCKGYVNYCNTLGIVVGMGDGTYKPNQGVTVAQTAKMLLVAMGYDPVVEGFEGANWEVNVNSIAAKAGLYNGVSANASAECSRDTAALVIYNALVANTVDGYVNGTAVVGEKTMLGMYFNAVVVPGVVVANDYANLFGNEALYNAKYSATELAILGDKYVDDDDAIDPGLEFLKRNAPEFDEDDLFPFEFSTSYVDEYGNNDYYESQIFQVGTTLEQVGKTVKVVAKLKDNYEYYYKNAVRYSEYTFTGEIIGTVMDVDCVVKEIEGEYDYFSTTDLKKEGVVFNSTTRYFMNYAVAWDSYGLPQRYSFDGDYIVNESATNGYNDKGFYQPAVSTRDDWDNIFFNADGVWTKFIDNDGDGIVEIVLQWRPFFAVVEYDSYYKTFTFDSRDGYATGIDPDDIISDEDIDDGDVVLVVPVDGKYYVEVCESETVTIDKLYINSDEAYFEYDGEKYYQSGLYWAYDTYKNSKEVGTASKDDDNELFWSFSKMDTDSDYVVYYDSYGNVVAYKEAKGGPPSDKFALVTSSYCYNKYTSTSEAEYTLNLTTPGASGTKETTVQWFGVRNRYVDEDAEAFFRDDYSAEWLLDYNEALYPHTYTANWRRVSVYTTYVSGHYGYEIIDGKASDIEGVESPGYSGGYYTALIKAEYDDDGAVDVSKPGGGPGYVTVYDKDSLDPTTQSSYLKYTTAGGTSHYATSDTVFFFYQYSIDTDGKITQERVYSVVGTSKLPTIEYTPQCGCGASIPCEDPEEECNNLYFTGITAIYGVANPDGDLEAVVIETNAELKQKVEGYFIYNYQHVSGSKPDRVYLVSAVDPDGEKVEFYIDEYTSDIFQSGKLYYGMFAREATDYEYDDETLYTITRDDSYKFNSIDVVNVSTIEYDNKYFYADGIAYYVNNSASAFYYRCEVAGKNSGVTDYQLVSTNFKNIKKYTTSYQIIYKETSSTDKEIVAVIGGCDNPIVFYPTLDVYAEADSQYGYDWVSMYSDYTGLKKGTIGYFVDRVALATDPSADMAPPA